MRKFIPHPEVALGRSKFNSDVHKAYYRYDYEQIFKAIANKSVDERGTYKNLVLTDLWFIIYFVMDIPDEKKPNHPFVVARANEIQFGDKDYTLDIWSRGHFKSTLLTVAETIQYQLTYPEHATGIFSHKSSIAKDNFLFALKQTFESSILLKKCFPDIVWENPFKEAPKWSLDGGLVLKRKTNRPEATISAHGLVEGMPTGLHFERMIYDDVVTQDVADSIDQMEKIKEKFDASRNLRTHTEVDRHRVIGTFYHHADPLVYIRDKKRAGTDDKMYKIRLFPATHDGSPNGEPVFMSQKELDDVKGDRTFACQQLCDPTPQGSQSLNSAFITEIEQELVPSDLYKFLVIDPAGDQATQKGTDSWAIMLFGVEPSADDAGASNVYLLNALISTLTESEAIEAIVRLYMQGGVIQKIGVEKVGLSSVETHVANALAKRGRNVSLENETLVLLRPAGRPKGKRIESALAWPLNNGKLYMSKAVPSAYRDRVRYEMDKFPYWHDDALDAWAYLYDIIRDYKFIYQKIRLPKMTFANATATSWMGG